MTLHAVVEYLKYKWTAKGRHGTHSPFVYDLVEQVLLSEKTIDREYMVVYPQLPLRYENLISRIAAHYSYKTILKLPAAEGATQPEHADMLLIDGRVPQQWHTLMSKHLPVVHNNGAVIVMDIHKTAAHSHAWMQLCKHARVRMCIDLYEVGVLFFREEFKVPQRFVLQY